MSDINISDLDADSEILGLELCSDDSDNWYIRVNEDTFLSEDGEVKSVNDGEMSDSCVFSNIVKAQQVAQEYGGSIDIEDQDAKEEDSVEKDSKEEVNGSIDTEDDTIEEPIDTEDDTIEEPIDTEDGIITEITDQLNQYTENIKSKLATDDDADDTIRDEVEETMRQTEDEIDNNSSSILSPELANIDQKRPDAQNVSINFVSKTGSEFGWSETMTEFWDKLERANSGVEKDRNDIYSDFWTRYRALRKQNSYARGDFIDMSVILTLTIIGFIILFAGTLISQFGSVSSLESLTTPTSYGDQIVITTLILSIVSFIFLISRRIASNTIVSAIKRPARGLVVTLLLVQLLVVFIVIYTLVFGGGQEALGLLEQSATQSLINILGYLPSLISDPLIKAVELYRGPQSAIFGLSIIQASIFMTLVGSVTSYPLIKRNLARLILTANMGPREFREETGILIEEISDGDDVELETPDYILGDKEVTEEQVEVAQKQEEEIEPIFGESGEELIALPEHIKSSPFDEYEEVTRYWVRAPYAYVSIVYNERQNDHRYIVVEPELTEGEKIIFDEIQERLDNILLFEDVKEYEDNEKETQAKIDKLERTMIELTNEYEIEIDNDTFHKLMYYVERDYVHYNKIDPLINDPNVEDISCDGEDQYIFVFHEDHKDVMTNIKFEKEELRSFIQELAQRSGEHISAADPMVDASLPDGSRAQMTLGSEITTRGSTFTIRLFEDIPFTPVDLLDYNTFSTTQMAYLWTAIEHNKSLIFAGGTASGKTTSMNAVSMFIPPKSKVITIEDTREISLPQENWIPGTTREGVGGEEGGDDIDMYALLKAALRQRPEYIVVGEIRGREAETLFQAMNTGHTTYSTMHAETVEAAIGRLTNPPINVPKQMITALDIICIQNQIRLNDENGNQKNVRRNQETREIVSLRDNGQFQNRKPFQWDAESDTFIESLENSHVLERVSNENGWTREDRREELNQRKEVLEYMLENDINEFDYVTNIIQAYMVDSEKIINQIRDDTLDPSSLDNLTDMDLSSESEPSETLNEQIASRNASKAEIAGDQDD